MNIVQGYIAATRVALTFRLANCTWRMQIYNLHQKHNKTPSKKFNYRYRQSCSVTTLYGYRGRIPETAKRANKGNWERAV